jgi:hypothetical protein
VTSNWLTGIDEMVKIRALVQRICSRCCLDSAKLIYQSTSAKTGFTRFKGWCPFKSKIEVSAAKL